MDVKNPKIWKIAVVVLITLSIVGATVPIATANPFTWSTETVDSPGDVGYYSSIALDTSNYPHISYQDNTNGDLKYAYKNATGWHNETVDGPDWVGQWTSIALDTNNYPHISYYDWTNYKFKHAYYDGSWHNEIVDTGDVGQFTSIAIDSLGYVHISYRYSASGDLKYARSNEAIPEFSTLLIPLIGTVLLFFIIRRKYQK